MKSLVIFCFGIIFTLFTITSALPTHRDQLVARVKIGKPTAPKPPPAAKAKAVAAPKPKPVAAPPTPKPVVTPPKPKTAPTPKVKADKCNQKASCAACTKTAADKCGFNPTTLKCITIGTGGVTASSLVTTANKASCPPLKQAANLPASASSAEINTQAQALLAKMSNHIFVGESTSDTSGRHTVTSWRAKNKDPGLCDNETHLCAFELNNKVPKTVFDNSKAGLYTESDIKAMCLTAIKLNLASSKGKADGAFVVQNKFAHPVCIQHAVKGQGSCFPLGIHATSSTLNSKCVTTGNNKDKNTVDAPL